MSARHEHRGDFGIHFKMTLYHRYNKEDELCQTIGYFSLNLRKGAVKTIAELLDLDATSTVGWVGCGDGRELLSIAKEHSKTQFDAFEINEVALGIARRVAEAENVRNVRFHHMDFLRFVDKQFSHVYSTAISGQDLYQKIFTACSRRICVLKEMWQSDHGFTKKHVSTVRIMGSGEQRQLVCGEQE